MRWEVRGESRDCTQPRPNPPSQSRNSYGVKHTHIRVPRFPGAVVVAPGPISDEIPLTIARRCDHSIRTVSITPLPSFRKAPARSIAALVKRPFYRIAIPENLSPQFLLRITNLAIVGSRWQDRHAPCTMGPYAPLGRSHLKETHHETFRSPCCEHNHGGLGCCDATRPSRRGC